MLIKSIVLSFLLIAVTQCSTAVQLTSKNYDLVLSSKEGWLIEFYSKKCGTCQEFEPAWHEVVKDLKDIKIGRVDIDDKDGLALAEKLAVLDDGIPHVLFVYGKDKFVTIMTGMGDLLNTEQLRSAINANVKKHLSLNKETGMYYKSDL